ncbi:MULTISPECIES: NUDIX domain-containing protein [Sphingobium]|uniref:NUDIX hydrolase n=1 Tax=Sphingobium baderi TaxID=1332080 RepID=A0A0S3EYC9_9SPHN|nr:MULTISPECIES: NUDIX domain-containing protein [Sphingobium]ALR20440.1 NUDIX hydrolase [Sphingobium baderi]
MTDVEYLARPAATVVVVRDRPQGPADILMMERARSMAFAGGALVFPGGAVDDGDRALAARLANGLELDDAAARIAAIRETLEESGLGIGFVAPPAPDLLAAMRRALADGADMAALVDAHGLELALDRLVPFTRWLPTVRTARIFDARFYLAKAPDDQEGSVDATENTRLFWSSARATLARCARGEGRTLFPTRRNLERLAQFDTFDALAAHAAATPPDKVRPWIEDRDGVPHLCIPTYLGYPVTSEPVATALRH